MADARGEYWYFDPDVDANKITVPELRSILLKHGVTYPSSAKKPVLVALFNEQVAPQAAKIQRAHARTKRSTRGIEDVPSSATSTTTTDDAEEEETLLPPQPTPRRTSRRTRASTEDADGVAPAPRGKTTSRAVPAKHSRASEADLDEQPALRRTRKSMTPAVKQPSPEPEAWHRDDIESPFTQDNPFQSGSSPILPETATRGGRRKTMGFEHKEKRKSDASRRKTVQPNVEQLDEGIVVPSRRTFDMPITRIKKEPSLEPDIPGSADAGEEFEPQEQMELSQERAKAGGIDILPPRRQKRSKATGTLKAFSMTLLATSAAVFGGVWRQEKIAVGFCGIGRHATGLAGVEVPEWANAILPQCEPCPPHAQCYRNLELTCDRDFIRKDHPLSLGGLIPLPPTCEPDSEKTRKITSVADKTVQILRKRRAQFECGEQDAEGNLVENPEVSKAELKEQLSAQKRKGMTDQEFSELFDRAFPEAILRDEVVESTNSTTGEHRLSSTSLAELSLSCSFRRSLRQSVERYLLQIVVIFLVIATGSYGKYSFTRSRAMEERAKYLAGEVFNRLADHAALSHQEPGANPEKGISMAQLRDDVLRNEFSSSRRQKLWERVQKKVEFNSNVRAAVRTTHSGDVARMWEWVGPVKLLEDGRSSSRQESGRYSMGLGSSPPPVPKEIKDSNAWNEDRPIY